MKIIAVNIKHNIAKMPAITATAKAWKLNIDKAKQYDYVIGFADGEIKESFKIDAVRKVKTQPDRIEFDLSACSPTEKKSINSAIKSIKLKSFVTKYIN